MRARLQATIGMVTTTVLGCFHILMMAMPDYSNTELLPERMKNRHPNNVHSPCSHVDKLHNSLPMKITLKENNTHSSWSVSNERILVISGHGAPHADTIYSLLEMGFSPESLYGICLMQYCWLTGYGFQSNGSGINEWSNKTITGTNKTMLQAAQRISRRGQKRFWRRAAEQGKNYIAFYESLANNSTHWDGGFQQQEFNKEVGRAMAHFTAVICPFPSKLCLPFLDDHFSHLKVIFRLTHRISHWDLKDFAVFATLKRMASDPSRFLIASNNAFDMAAMDSLSLGNNWIPPWMINQITRLDPIPLQVLFWPSYYRHVREYSNDKCSRLSTPLVIEVGAYYREVTKNAFLNFQKTTASSESHGWTIPVKSNYNMTDYASLAIVFPYSTHSAKVNELYARSVPMIAPSISLLIELGNDLRPSEVQPHIHMSDAFLSKVNPPRLCHPNASSPPLHQWAAWSDVYTHPFIRYFDSFEELPEMIDKLIGNPGLLEETRAKMKMYWDQSYEKTSKSVRTTLERFLMA